MPYVVIIDEHAAIAILGRIGENEDRKLT